MSIQRLISEISRKIGSLEVVHYGREQKSTLKSKDLLAGAYISDGFIELIGVTGTEISLEHDKFLKYEKLNENVYRIYNRRFNILIRPIEY